jgi:hypothetical protein
MIPAMRAVTSSQSAYAALRFGQLAAMGLVTGLILIAGVWASWGTAQHVMLSKGREQGTIAVRTCSGEVCSGPTRPSRRVRGRGPGSSSSSRWR